MTSPLHAAASTVLLLAAAGAAGCTRPPVAALTGPFCAVAGTGAPLDATASRPGRLPIETYRFDFGDGTPALISRADRAVHIYREPGDYEAELTVADREGAASVARVTVSVKPDYPSCGVVPTGVPRVEVGACATDGLLDCLLDVGVAPAEGETSAGVVVTNTGTVALDVTASTVPGTSFRVDPEGEVALAPWQAARFEVTFTPRPGQPGRVQEELRLRDSRRALGLDGLVVVLEGTVDGEVFPRLRAEPVRCRLAAVPVESTAPCPVTLRNTGNTGLQVDRLQLATGSTAGWTLPDAVLPLQLAPGAAATVTILMSVDHAGPQRGALQVFSNDPLRPQLDVALDADVVDLPPVPRIRVVAVNGAPWSPGQALAPLDDVLLDAADSTAGRAGRTVTAYAWELAARPDVSGATLASATATRTWLRFDSSSMERPGMDVAGRYVVRLQVTDSEGLPAAAPAELVLDAVPAAALHIQLTWEDPDVDLDLHLIKGGFDNAFSSTLDCNFDNCDTGGGLPWTDHPAANPRLNLDDTRGLGPEHVFIAAPDAGRYSVAVHFYDAHGQRDPLVRARVRVFVRGELALDAVRQLSPCKVLWEAATVDWAAAPVVSAVSAVRLTGRGACQP
ncbi:MAG: PKD domain-containing protein [Deltaproteobacteria bacterium]|nr:PKD domain-containing protein [Deltaproteobacteria bacterium]